MYTKYFLMFDSIKATNEAILQLRDYTGVNPYILKLRRDVVVRQNPSVLNEFSVEYILKNKDFVPKPIGKTIEIADWFGEKLQKDYEIEFIPQKLKIYTLIGETSTTFHCLIRYRQSMEPMDLFIPKKAVLGNFLIDDYHDFKVDFDRYDRLSQMKDPNRKLKEHQKEAVKFLLSRKRCILADDMGVGKTTELAVAAVEGNFDSILIICPASLKTQWRDELLWYVPERDITIIDSFNGKTKAEMEKFLGYAEGKSGLSNDELNKECQKVGQWKENRIIILNYDIVDRFYHIPVTRSKANIEKAMELSPMLQFILNKKALLIVDEAHKLSNNSSIRYKTIKDLIKRGNPDCVFLATGTPITNSPENFYHVMQLIEQDITGDWQYYMERYCGAMKIPAKGEKEKWTTIFLNRKKKNSWYDLTDKEKDELKTYIRENARMITIMKDPANLEELKKRVQHIYLRRTKEDISEGLPNKSVHEVFYDFDVLQMMEYDRLWDEYEAAQLEADPTKEINKDLLEGAIYRKYCSNQMVPNTIKLANSFIEKGEKVIIATCYDEELNTLKDYYGNRCVVYNGKMNAKQKDAARDAFMTDPNIMVFIGNIIAAGVGLNLTVSHIMIFNNIDFVPGNDRQMEDRIYRIGQKHDVDIYYQMFNGTQYVKIWNTVMRKELAINQVIKKENEK